MGTNSKIDNDEKEIKSSKDFEGGIPKKSDTFEVLKLARQNDHKIKPFLVSIYIINAVRTVVTLSWFTFP